MESRNLRGFKRQPPPPRAHSSNYNYFVGHPRQGGYMGLETGRFPSPQLHPGPFLHPHPYRPPDIHQAIQRDIEKQRIREEIILAEIARRRELEEEVRAELMLERELAFRTGNPFLFSPAMGLDHSPMRFPVSGARPEGMRFLEEKNKSSVEERERGKGFEVEGEPFHRGTGDLKISGLEPVSGGGIEKKKIILLPKPDENMSGSKRKAETSLGGDDSELPPDIISKKKVGWSCELCQVKVTSEIGLIEHYRGKKHKAKEAATKTHKAGMNYSIGLIQKKSKETLQIVETVAPIAQDGLSKAAVESPKNESEIVKEMQKIGNPEETNFKFWCELCGVRAPCRTTMNKHKRGKRHLKRVANQPLKVVVHVNQAEDVDDAEKEISESVIETSLDEVSLVGDHGHVDPVKSGDDTAALGLTEPMITNENKAQDCLAVDHLTKEQNAVAVDHVEELAGVKVAISESLIKTLCAVNSECLTPAFKNKAEEEPENGKDAVLENLSETLDALNSDYDMPERQIKVEDDGTRKRPSPEPFRETKPKDAGAATEPVYYSTNVVNRANELTENTTSENGTGASAMEETEAENDDAVDV